MLQKDFISALRFVIAAMPTKEVRHYLNGVYLEFNEGGTISLTASDGPRLHTVTMEHDHGQPTSAYIVDATSAKVWITAVRPDRIDLDISAPCGVPVLHNIPAVLCEGTYPSYRRVIPSGDPQPTESIFFNIDYLSASAKALKVLGCKVCRIELFGDTGAIKITPRYDTNPAITEAIAVVMPIDLKRG